MCGPSGGNVGTIACIFSPGRDGWLIGFVSIWDSEGRDLIDVGTPGGRHQQKNTDVCLELVSP